MLQDDASHGGSGTEIQPLSESLLLLHFQGLFSSGWSPYRDPDCYNYLSSIGELRVVPGQSTVLQPHELVMFPITGT